MYFILINIVHLMQKELLKYLYYSLRYSHIKLEKTLEQFCAPPSTWIHAILLSTWSTYPSLSALPPPSLACSLSVPCTFAHLPYPIRLGCDPKAPTYPWVANRNNSAVASSEPIDVRSDSNPVTVLAIQALKMVVLRARLGLIWNDALYRCSVGR